MITNKEDLNGKHEEKVTDVNPQDATQLNNEEKKADEQPTETAPTEAQPGKKKVLIETSKLQMYRANWYHGYNANQRNHKMKRYIYKTKNSIDIINLDEAKRMLDRSLMALRRCVGKGGRVMFVGTGDEISTIVEETAKRCGQSYISKKWPGGLLTNFENSFAGVINRMKQIRKKIENDELDSMYNKKEQIKIKKQNDKYFAQLGGVKDMSRPPDMVVFTSMREKNAIRECAKKGIQCIALVDTNGNPSSVDHPVKYAVPGNEKSIQTISLFLAYCGDYSLLGLRDESLMSIKDQEDKAEQAKKSAGNHENGEHKPRRPEGYQNRDGHRAPHSAGGPRRAPGHQRHDDHRGGPRR